MDNVFGIRNMSHVKAADDCTMSTENGAMSVENAASMNFRVFGELARACGCTESLGSVVFVRPCNSHTGESFLMFAPESLFEEVV